MICILLLIVMNAWCAQETVDLGESVVRFYDDEQAKSLRLKTLPGPLTEGFVEHSWDGFDFVRLATEDNFCTLKVCSGDVLEANNHLILEVRAGCNDDDFDGVGCVNLDCSGFLSLLSLRYPSNQKRTSRVVCSFASMCLNPESCGYYEYSFEETAFNMKQVLCEYTNGEQFLVKTEIQYSNCMEARLTWGMSTPDRMRMRGEDAFCFFASFV